LIEFGLFKPRWFIPAGFLFLALIFHSNAMSRIERQNGSYLTSMELHKPNLYNPGAGC
jgi:hypothetical protein